MPVYSVNAKLSKRLKAIELCRDAIEGEDALKAKATTYIPEFEDGDEKRYKAYVIRANYLNVTARTQNGLVGAIFRRDPKTELPTQLEYLLEDFDGGGQSLIQLGKESSLDVLATGRYGFLTDYPAAPEGLTVEQVEAFKVRAAIATYKNESIIDWKTKKVGGATILTQVRLVENVTVPVDEYETKEEKQCRVLSLDDSGNYIQQIFNEAEELIETIEPKGVTGQRLNYIPFSFAGADNNLPDPDKPPMYDIAKVNISLFRNSADYEESLFIHGQGTLFVSSDMSVDQFTKANPNGVMVGSRKGHFLGANGDAKLVQVEANSAIREAMEDKEDAMKMIGARMATDRTGTQTAEAAKIDSSAETSVLSTITGNVSEAIENALKFACDFMGGDPEKVVFTLNQSFFDETATFQDLMALISLEDRGTIAKADTRAKLRKSGWIDKNRTDAEIDEEAEVTEIL